MTNEEKQLLLADLCARLPYGVICQFVWTYNNETTDGEDVIAEEDDNIRCIDLHTKEIQADYYGEWVDLEQCKPYLRPMSSMTDDEREDWYRQSKVDYDCEFKPEPTLSPEHCHLSVNWLNKKMFDYRGLIPIGLALEAPEGMYIF